MLKSTKKAIEEISAETGDLALNCYVVDGVAPSGVEIHQKPNHERLRFDHGSIRIDPADIPAFASALREIWERLGRPGRPTEKKPAAQGPYR